MTDITRLLVNSTLRGVSIRDMLKNHHANIKYGKKWKRLYEEKYLPFAKKTVKIWRFRRRKWRDQAFSDDQV